MKSSKGQMGFSDRVSELPEFVLHIVLSFLSTDEACRTSILSKIWYNAWESMPVLDFQLKYIEKWCAANCYDDKLKVQIYMGIIDKTMQRYSERKYFIRKICLKFPNIDEKLAIFIDKWLGIAVQNKVEELGIEIINQESPNYRLPETVFVARSLRVLRSQKVVLPYYRTMQLHSLERIELFRARIDESMLQHILCFCPLIDLKLSFCSGLKSITIPWETNESVKSLDYKMMHSDVKASTLREFIYWGESSWPCAMNVGALKNLRTLELHDAPVTDDNVSVLVSGLPLLDKLVLFSCYMLRSIKISSKLLKKFWIVECLELEKATIDTPNLLSFWYNGQPEPSLSIINAPAHCDSHLYVAVESVSMKWFIALKEFLVESNIFKALEMNFSTYESEIDLVEDTFELAGGPHYKLKELKFHNTCHWMLDKSTLSAFLDGLFWSCHPDVLTIHKTTDFRNNTIQFILETLKDKVQCWRHPLKRIEVKGVDFSGLLWHCELEIGLRLYW